MSRVLETESGLFLYHRLAIMDLSEMGMQPFSLGKNALICNGEIYGFRKIIERLSRSGYTFRTGSDCEVLLPMYETYGTGMFEKLDAEFALVLYDGEKDLYIAARDPIGIRPLFYGYSLRSGSILFASEAINLVGLVKEIRPFPPGHYYMGHAGAKEGEGTFTRYMDLTTVQSPSEDGLDEAASKIHDLLIEGIEKRLDADAPVGFLLSGGLDSSLVCAVSRKILGKRIRTFAIGMEKDPIDLKYARETADFIGADHMEVTMSEEEILRTLPELIRVLGTWDITTIRASMGMYLCCRAIHEKTDVRVLLTGEISDELFGYKYTDFAPDPASFQAEAKKRIDQIHCYDVLRADRCIGENSLEARVPFGDLAFVRYVMRLNPALKMNTYNCGKYLLRRAFEKDGLLPENILWRQKAAFSDAVGHSLADGLKACAERKYSDADFIRLSGRYDYCRPFTKESLLYREIFERFYPKQARMIPDFWMPNRSWEGCDVDDPSARALSNYGTSGD